nr:MAG: hypothetical protein AM324_10970 [Candidatus Thorarchaeota archaeon SMTZ1-83]
MRVGNSSRSILASLLGVQEGRATTQDYSELSNEKLLFILNRFTGVAPYSHEFVHGVQDAQVISGFVSAITSFMGEITGKELTHWRTHYGSDSTLLVEGGDWALGVLVVKRETDEVRSRLRRVVREFEDCFAVLRDADGIEGGAFKEFDNFVRRTFVGDRLCGRSVILKGLDWNEESISSDLPSWSFKIAKILLGMKDRQTLDEAMSILDASFADTAEVISRALWNRSINVVYVPDENDILLLSGGSSSLLLTASNPLGLSIDSIKTIGALDGRSPIASILRKVQPQHVGDSLLELGLLVNRGLIQRASLERQLVLINECILTRMMKACSKAMGARVAKRILRMAIDQVLARHSWAARIEYTRGFKIKCRLEDGLLPMDLDEVCDMLESLQQEVIFQVSDEDPSFAESSLHDAKTDCHNTWAPYLRDMIA